MEHLLAAAAVVTDKVMVWLEDPEVADPTPLVPEVLEHLDKVTQAARLVAPGLHTAVAAAAALVELVEMVLDHRAVMVVTD